MTRDQAQWWRRAAQSLSRAGLLWLALTAVALGSMVSSGAALAPSARLVAASAVTGKLKANGPGAPSVVPGHLTHRALGPDTDAKRVHAGGTPVGLIPTAFVLIGPESADKLSVLTDVDHLNIAPRAFSARAPPRIA